MLHVTLLLMLLPRQSAVNLIRTRAAAISLLRVDNDLDLFSLPIPEAVGASTARSNEVAIRGVSCSEEGGDAHCITVTTVRAENTLSFHSRSPQQVIYLSLSAVYFSHCLITYLVDTTIMAPSRRRSQRLQGTSPSDPIIVSPPKRRRRNLTSPQTNSTSKIIDLTASSPETSTSPSPARTSRSRKGDEKATAAVVVDLTNMDDSLDYEGGPSLQDTKNDTPSQVFLDDQDDDLEEGCVDLGFEEADEEDLYMEQDLDGSQSILAVPGRDMLNEDIEVARIMIEPTGIELEAFHASVAVTMPLDELAPLARSACGLTRPDPLIITLNFNQGYRKTSPSPAVKVRQGDVETSSTRVNPNFPMGLQLTQTATVFLQQRWAKRGDNFLADLFLRLWDRLNNAGNTCQLCDREMPFPGVKPTICEDALCRHQQETLGFGADLSLFDTDPAVADLLITAAVAACNDTVRHQVSPTAMPVNKDDKPYTPKQLQSLLDKVPETSLLSDAGEGRIKLLDEVDPSVSRIVGWIFATNRAHIVSLEPGRRVPEMKTDHQFQIHTSTRKHAEKFEALRAAHGSFYAFHGSGMSNWHNILRQNLKNASSTPMMSTGAAYGQGIYLAASSSTSASYTRAATAWANSAFGSMPSCLALVEVANSSRVHSHMQGSIVVASDENCVMLRKLFVYPSSSNGDSYGYGLPSVLANSLANMKYKNKTTIAYGLTPEEVDPKNLLVTSDEYFWDIHEVVSMVESKQGLFINGYTQLPLAPRDIKAILDHPSGAGATLRKLEKENAKLRKNIPANVITKINSVGQACKHDHSTEMTGAHAAIAELQTWLEDQPQLVRDALKRVPFDAVDSHTGLKFRDTVEHATELVTSGGECVSSMLSCADV